MNEDEVSIPGIMGRVTISPAGVLRGARILIDGSPAKKGGWGKVMLQRVDGSTAEAKLVDHLTRTVPSIQIGNEKYEMGEAIPTAHVILALLPIGLVGVGGALGGLCGGVGWGINQAIIRSNKSPSLKAVMMICVLLAAAAVYVGLASLFRMAVK